jgi:hypothetical protein
VQQPLRKMGRLAAETVLQRISASPEDADARTARITIEAALMVRGTTSALAARTGPAEKDIARRLPVPHPVPTLNLG